VNWEKISYGLLYHLFDAIPFDLWRDDDDCRDALSMADQLYAEFMEWA
jgi:hypothetical protein